MQDHVFSRPLGKYSERFAIPMDRTDIHISLPSRNADRGATSREVGIDERSEVLIATIRLFPQSVELAEYGARHFECAPDPMRGGIRCLHQYLLDSHPVFLREHHIKEFRTVHRKK